MLRKITAFVLRCRLEDIAAATFSATLLIFFLTTRIFVSFKLNGHDIIFILLPAGILGVKSLLEMLSASDSKPGKIWARGNFSLLFSSRWPKSSATGFRFCS